MKEFTDTLKEVIGSLADMAEKERKESESYKDMFKTVPGDNFEGLLRDTELRMIRVVLDACQVIKEKTGKNVDQELFDVLGAFPFVQDKLEKHISNTEGSCCCVDKAYYLLDKFVKEHLK